MAAGKLAAAVFHGLIDPPATWHMESPRLAALRLAAPDVSALLSTRLTGWNQKSHRRKEFGETIGALSLLAQSQPFSATLVTRALFSSNPAVATHAADALGRLAETFAGGSLAVITAFRGRRGLGGATAAHALTILFDRYPHELFQFSEDPDDAIRARIVRCSGRAMRAAGGKSRQHIHRFRDLCVKALQDDGENVRAAAVEALAWAHDVRVIPLVTAALADSSPTVRSMAVDVLARTGLPSAVMAIAEHLETLPAGERQQARGVVMTRHPPAPDTLLNWLRDDDPARRGAALELLAAAPPDQRTIDAVLDLCADDDILTVRAAARTLAAMVRLSPFLFRREGNLERLLSLDTDDVESIGTFVETLALTGDDRVIEALMARIPISGRYVREKVVEGLALFDLIRNGSGGSSQEKATTLVAAR